MRMTRWLHLGETLVLALLLGWMCLLTLWHYGDARAQAARDHEARIWYPWKVYADTLAARVENMGCYWYDPGDAPYSASAEDVDKAAETLP